MEMSPTQHAGHARDLARQAARTAGLLIISVSGDGGYNEVVDGVNRPVTQTRSQRQRPPPDDRGNARSPTRWSPDRSTGSTSDRPAPPHHRQRPEGTYPVRALLHRARVDPGGRHRPGEGRQGLPQLRETVSVIRSFARFRPFSIRLDDGERRQFDNLLFANISEMPTTPLSARPETPTTASSR